MCCQGSSECFLYPLAEFKEPTSKRREGKGGIGKGEKGVERGRVQMKAEGNRRNKGPTTTGGERRRGKVVRRSRMEGRERKRFAGTMSN